MSAVSALSSDDDDDDDDDGGREGEGEGEAETEMRCRRCGGASFRARAGGKVVLVCAACGEAV